MSAESNGENTVVATTAEELTMQAVSAMSESHPAAVAFANDMAFKMIARKAKALSESTIVPKEFKGNAGNCYIACEMAHRLDLSEIQVMQSMYIVYGNPSFKSEFLISQTNKSGRFKYGVQYDIQGSVDGGDLSCVAFGIDARTGKELRGPKITLQMAHDEGWSKKDGSKWKTMPELMIRYRAAAFFIRTTAPELTHGMKTSEELYDQGPPEISVERNQAIEDMKKRFGDHAKQIEASREPTEEPSPERGDTPTEEPAEDLAEKMQFIADWTGQSFEEKKAYFMGIADQAVANDNTLTLSKAALSAGVDRYIKAFRDLAEIEDEGKVVEVLWIFTEAYSKDAK
jgi:hypothetical protein